MKGEKKKKNPEGTELSNQESIRTLNEENI